MREIMVTINITSDINIPNNSIAIIKPDLLGVTSLEIKLGNSAVFLKNNMLCYANSCALVRDADFRVHLHKITTETLVITGDDDSVTNVAQAEELVKNIPNASLKVIPARHLSSTELPKEYAGKKYPTKYYLKEDSAIDIHGDTDFTEPQMKGIIRKRSKVIGYFMDNGNIWN